jgi:pyridoxamine 5'-phosphate oxidase
MADCSPDAADPFAKFHAWMAEAIEHEPSDPNAMTVVTATPDGTPSARTILLKGVDDRGFVFYTNKESRKAVELAANKRIFLLFYWKSLARQIRIEGTVEHVTDAESDAYFASRARISRLGAWASLQSRPLADRAELERRLADYESRYPGEDIPRPPYWSGYRVIPTSFEFWQDMPFRLHDRSTYTRTGGTRTGGTRTQDTQTGGGWTIGKLFP